jgi:hypothetical protein
MSFNRAACSMLTTRRAVSDVNSRAGNGRDIGSVPTTRLLSCGVHETLGHYSKTPHVAFKAEVASGKSARNEPTRLFESHLCDRYGSVRQVGIRIHGSRLHVLHVGRKEITVVWYRSRFKDGEWISLVGRYDLPPLDRFRGRQPIIYSEELKLVSRGIQALLARRPASPVFGGISKGYLARVVKLSGRRMN